MGYKSGLEVVACSTKPVQEQQVPLQGDFGIDVRTGIRWKGVDCMSKMTRVHIQIQPELWDEVGYVAKELRISKGDVVRKALRGQLEQCQGSLRYVNAADGEVLVKKISEIFNNLQDIDFEIHRIGVNLNQIAKTLNSSGILLSSEKTMLANYMKSMGPILKQIIHAKEEMEATLCQYQG